MIPCHPAEFARIRRQPCAAGELSKGSCDTTEPDWLAVLQRFQTRTILKSRTDQRQQLQPDHIIIEFDFGNRRRVVVAENHPMQ